MITSLTVKCDVIKLVTMVLPVLVSPVKHNVFPFMLLLSIISLMSWRKSWISIKLLFNNIINQIVPSSTSRGDWTWHACWMLWRFSMNVCDFSSGYFLLFMVAIYCFTTSFQCWPCVALKKATSSTLRWKYLADVEGLGVGLPLSNLLAFRSGC